MRPWIRRTLDALCPKWVERVFWLLVVIHLQRAKGATWKQTLAIAAELWPVWTALDSAAPGEREAVDRWMLTRWNGRTPVRIIIERPSGRVFVGHGKPPPELPPA